MTAADILIAAKALLVDKGWNIRWPALDSNGVAVSWMSPDAVSFDIDGAFRRAAWKLKAGKQEVRKASIALEKALDPGLKDPYIPAMYYREGEEGKQLVLGWFDQAIAAAQR